MKQSMVFVFDVYDRREKLWWSRDKVETTKTNIVTTSYKSDSRMTVDSEILFLQSIDFN